ncbi:MAG: helix-hairpin-helix domain-containing protein [Candidatus Hydrogenedentes bacterium]|nr:helix-hairpin-helix domain-containing protein [Candidatus Hydrogenedentota bacterium]
MLNRVFTSREQILLIGCASAICVGGIAYYIAQREAPAPVEIREIQIPVPQEKREEPVEQPVLSAVEAREPEKANPVRRISVSVTGAVTTPGVYEFDETERVEDAIEAAGGATGYGDLSDINKAAELIDGSALVIPVAGREGVEDGKRLVIRTGQSAAALNPAEYTISGWRSAARSRSSGSVAPSGTSQQTGTASTAGSELIDVNSASAEELETLPGVGPKLADAIIQYRKKQPFQTVDDLNNVPGIGDKRLADMRALVRVGP